MRIRARTVAIAAMAAIAVALTGVLPAGPRLDVAAQEGHPLSGTWTGDWQAGGTRNHLTVVMSWDGKAVTGLANPGPDAIPLTRVVVDWAAWTVRIEGERTTGGEPATIRAEGRLEDIGSPRRRLTGTWTQGDVSGEFGLRRE